MKILGLDIGKKRIGVAVSDDRHVFAFPLTTIQADRGFRHVLSELEKLIHEHDISTIVIGYPLDVNDHVTESTRLAETYLKKIKAAFPDITIESYDESYSTLEAQSIMNENQKKKKKQKDDIDKIAAAVILKRYLDETK